MQFDQFVWLVVHQWKLSPPKSPAVAGGLNEADLIIEISD